MVIVTGNLSRESEVQTIFKLTSVHPLAAGV